MHCSSLMVDGSKAVLVPGSHGLKALYSLTICGGEIIVPVG